MYTAYCLYRLMLIFVSCERLGAYLISNSFRYLDRDSDLIGLANSLVIDFTRKFIYLRRQLESKLGANFSH